MDSNFSCTGLYADGMTSTGTPCFHDVPSSLDCLLKLRKFEIISYRPPFDNLSVVYEMSMKHFICILISICLMMQGPFMQ